MAWQKQLQEFDKRQTIQREQLERIEEKLEIMKRLHMAWQKQLQGFDKKQTIQGEQLERVEGMLEIIIDAGPVPAVTIEQLIEIDGVGPATAQKILELVGQ